MLAFLWVSKRREKDAALKSVERPDAAETVEMVVAKGDAAV